MENYKINIENAEGKWRRYAMRVFDFLECFNTEINIQIYEGVSEEILYIGKIGDVPHKVSRMRNIMLETTDVKEGIVQLFTEISCESDCGEMNVK